ncbi:MAG: helix-turn-helix domain-containing protein [Phreatobacter sp.]|uniref:TetR/AcrR family transcriptional regulator n=1 Tax=Phreatobacter sp. TaxID=1966341 RepID=UPI002735C99C|nr:TetR/AcrR family transcriptional regulator [Phreatobacter sp.]MDP2803154.1 helix-turn-helix domain-containing protein [Phreatobacter sp.]
MSGPMTDFDRVDRIRNAALETFLRFGFRKTTMNDIAERAGMSRPALYLLFPNKEAVFRAVIAGMAEDALADIRLALPGLGGRREKLRYVLDRWCVNGYALAMSTPQARDLVDGCIEVGREEMAAAFKALEQMIVEILGAGDGPAPIVLAQLLTAAAIGHKRDQPAVDLYRQKLHDAVDAVLAAHGGV